MYVELTLVVDFDGLVLREEPYLHTFVVEDALVGLPHGDNLLHRLAGRHKDAAPIGGNAVHQDLQSQRVGHLLHHDVVAEVEALRGGAVV